MLILHFKFSLSITFSSPKNTFIDCTLAIANGEHLMGVKELKANHCGHRNKYVILPWCKQGLFISLKCISDMSLCGQQI